MLIRKQMGDSPVVGWKYGTSHQYFETFLFVWQIYKKRDNKRARKAKVSSKSTEQELLIDILRRQWYWLANSSTCHKTVVRHEQSIINGTQVTLCM